MFKFNKPSNWAENVFNVLFILSVVFTLLFLIRPDKLRISVHFFQQNKYLIPLITILFTILFAIISVVKKQRENKIKKDNFKIMGEVVSINRAFFRVSVIKKDSLISPYIIKYKYSNDEYVSKSQYIWEIPKCNIGSSIQVLVDRDKPSRSIVSI